jgi:hypothetical protein
MGNPSCHIKRTLAVHRSTRPKSYDKLKSAVQATLLQHSVASAAPPLIYNSLSTPPSFTSPNLSTVAPFPIPIPNDLKGDSITSKSDSDFWVIFQNINSLRPTLQDQSKWKATLQRIQYLRCDISALGETCVNWRLNSLKKKYTDKILSIFPKYHLSTTITKLRHPQECLPGGNLVLTIGNYVGRISSHINDPYQMGRWTGTVYHAGPHQLHVISAYRVCKTKVTSTFATSSYAQQLAIAIEHGIPNANPGNLFIQHFIDQYQAICTTTSDYVMLLLDANETIGDEKLGLQKLMLACNMVDPYSLLHNDTSDFPTHECGSHRIDYMLCTPNLVKFISRIGYTQLNEAFDSDHWAIFSDMSTTIFAQSLPEVSRKICMVGTTTTNQEGINYVTYLYDHLQQSNVYYDCHSLLLSSSQPGADIPLLAAHLNDIDETITKLMLQAEKKTCKKQFCHLHSNNLKFSRYTTCTALGTSLEPYQHTVNTLIHGTGQGSCASPAIWLLISSFLMRILQRMATGMKIHDFPQPDITFIQWIEGFVDDTSLFTNLPFSQDDINTLRLQLQTDGTIWSRLLQASGELQLQKCCYYLLGWTWDCYGNPVPMTVAQTDPTVQDVIIWNGFFPHTTNSGYGKS